MILSSKIDLISRLKRANEVNCLEDSGISFHNFSPHIWIDFWLDSNLVVIIFDLLVDRKLYECVSFSLFRSKWLVIETGSRCLFRLYINLLFSKNTVLLTSRIPSSLKIAWTSILPKGAKVMILIARVKMTCKEFKALSHAFPQVKIPYRTYTVNLFTGISRSAIFRNWKSKSVLEFRIALEVNRIAHAYRTGDCRFLEFRYRARNNRSPTNEWTNHEAPSMN